METYQVAYYYSLDPSIVENWSNVEFLDRQEFMFVQMETDRQFQKYIDKKNGLGNG